MCGMVCGLEERQRAARMCDEGPGRDANSRSLGVLDEVVRTRLSTHRSVWNRGLSAKGKRTAYVSETKFEAVVRSPTKA